LILGGWVTGRQTLDPAQTAWALRLGDAGTSQRGQQEAAAIHYSIT
jgi:hypothetical protein